VKCTNVYLLTIAKSGSHDVFILLLLCAGILEPIRKAFDVVT